MKNRLAAMHDCPVLIVRALTAVLTARPKSALGITMNGSLPPSSSTALLDFARSNAAHSAAGPLAACKRDSLDSRIDNYFLSLLGFD